MQTTTTITIRTWSEADLDNLVKYADNWNIARYLTDKFPHPYSESDGRAFIELATKGDPVHMFAVDLDGQAIGGIGIHPQTDVHRKNAELGYWLAEPFWGRGIISHAIRQILDFAFNTYDINRVFARAYGTNLPSQRVLEKNCFTLEGRFEKTVFKNGEYLDELIYAMRRADWEKYRRELTAPA